MLLVVNCVCVVWCVCVCVWLVGVGSEWLWVVGSLFVVVGFFVVVGVCGGGWFVVLSCLGATTGVKKILVVL